MEKIRLEHNGRSIEVEPTEDLLKFFEKGKYNFKAGQPVYLLTSAGSLESRIFDVNNEHIRGAYLRNKVFGEIEDLCFEDQKTLLMAEIDRFIDDNDGEFTQEEWTNPSIRKYFLETWCERGINPDIEIQYTFSFKQYGVKYFRSEEIAKKALELFRDKLIKYL